MKKPWLSEYSLTAQTEVIIPDKAEMKPIAKQVHPAIKSLFFEREVHIWGMRFFVENDGKLLNCAYQNIIKKRNHKPGHGH